MKYKFDHTKVSATDWLGNDYIKVLEENQKAPLHKLVGNVVHVNTRTLEMDEIARKIFNGEVIEMGENEREQFVNVIKSSPWHDFINNNIINAIEDL